MFTEGNPGRVDHTILCCALANQLSHLFAQRFTVGEDPPLTLKFATYRWVNFNDDARGIEARCCADDRSVLFVLHHNRCRVSPQLMRRTSPYTSWKWKRMIESDRHVLPHPQGATEREQRSRSRSASGVVVQRKIRFHAQDKSIKARGEVQEVCRKQHTR